MYYTDAHTKVTRIMVENYLLDSISNMLKHFRATQQNPHFAPVVSNRTSEQLSSLSMCEGLAGENKTFKFRGCICIVSRREIKHITVSNTQTRPLPFLSQLDALQPCTYKGPFLFSQPFNPKERSLSRRTHKRF